jgi:hypothetical protein
VITFFACPKAFRGHTGVIQRNAIRSWTLLRPKPEIVLLGDEEGVADICEEFGLIHIPEIDRNEYGTPLVNSVFQVGQARASHSVVCYVNSDIMLMSGFVRAVDAVANRMDKFLILGQRTDVDIKEAWDLSGDWERDLWDLIARKGTLHPPNGIDFFCFPRGMYDDVPPFAIGRLAWDNWLVWRARSQDVPVVDITGAASVVHQNHGYGADKIRRLSDQEAQAVAYENTPGKTVFDGHWVELGPEARRNIGLLPEEQNLNIWAATWSVDQNGVLRRRPLTLTVPYLLYQVKCIVPLYWPAFGRLIYWIRTAKMAVRKTVGSLVRRPGSA